MLANHSIVGPVLNTYTLLVSGYSTLVIQYM